MPTSLVIGSTHMKTRNPRELILVRHGESEHHTKGLTGGWTDTPLTQRGMSQSEAVGQALALLCSNGHARFLSSDLLRAKGTAEIIAEQINVLPSFHVELRELNNGAAKDKTLKEAEQIALPLTRPTADWVPYPGAESWRAMTSRVTAFLEAVAKGTEEDVLLVVSHGNAMVAIVHWWLELEDRYWSSISYQFDCGSITRLSVNEWGERVIKKLNDTSHLRTRELLEQDATLDRQQPRGGDRAGAVYPKRYPPDDTIPNQPIAW